MTPLVKLSDITVDNDLQPRAFIKSDVVDEYAEAMQQGDCFPAIILFKDGDINWLADGYHRFYAARKAGLDELSAEFRTGTKLDALRHALSANVTHGLRRSQADRRRAVLIAIQQFRSLSNREIGRMVKVDDKTVGKYRSRLAAVEEINARIFHGESFVGWHYLREDVDFLFIFKRPGPYALMFLLGRDAGGPHLMYDTRGCAIKWNECHVRTLSDFRLDMTDFDQWIVMLDPQVMLEELLELTEAAV